MEIKLASTENDFIKINDFLGKIWKEEFDLERFDQLEKYKKCDIYFFEKENEVISAIVFIKSINSKNGKNYIWRFATKKEFRGKGYGTKLINHTLEKNIGEINLDSEPKQVEYYKKFGFIETGTKKEIGNTYGIGMIKN